MRFRLRKRIWLPVGLVLFLLGAVMLPAFSAPVLFTGSFPVLTRASSGDVLFVSDSCSIFTAVMGDTVLYGNNEDFNLEGTYMWIVPSQEITTPSGSLVIHGFIGFGYNYNGHGADGWVQGAMNDAGLCVDGNGLPTLSMNAHPERDALYLDPVREVLFECSTVTEAIAWFQTHNCGTQWGCQLHIADVTGDAVVVSVYNGEFNFTQINSAHYLVSTNFNLANHSNGAYPCTRYNTATSMLSAIGSEAELTVEACRDVLDAVHEEGTYGTKYSNIFDPVNRQVYLFQNHDFDRMVTLDLDAELAQVHPGGVGVIQEELGYYREVPISLLFEVPTVPPLLLILGIGGVVISVVVVVVLIVWRMRRQP
jgi:choloylglycine hydrolase